MKVVVTGSLGHISKPLTNLLIKNGHSVVVITSTADRETEIQSLGAEAATGSVEDTDFLTRTFSGADAVYAMVPPNFKAPDIIAYYEKVGESYATAIRNSGIKKVVLLSSWGAHLPAGTGVIVGSYRVEQLFNKIEGIVMTYLRPSSFYYNLYHHINMIKTAGFIGTNFGGEDLVAMVSPEDIAEAAFEEIETSGEGRKIRYVASDERTCNETAAVLGRAIGKPDLKWITFSDEDTKAGMMQHHVPESVADLLVELNAAIHSGLMAEDYTLHKPQFGKVKLEDFASQFAAAYNQPATH